MGENQKPARRRGSQKQADARREARRAAREAVMSLLFETEYHEDETPEAIYLRAADLRELDTAERAAYIRHTYFGIMQNLSVIDALIGRHATGWRTGRLSRVSRAVLRLGVYELAFDTNTPAAVAINEAVELSKKFDDPKARAFVNGVLNAVKDELVAGDGRLPADLVSELAASPAVEGMSAEATTETAPEATTETATEATAKTAAETAEPVAAAEVTDENA